MANLNTRSSHSAWHTQRLLFSPTSMNAYGHTWTTLLYATSRTNSCIRQTTRIIRSMYARFCSDWRNTASSAKPRSVKLECRTSASCSLLSLPMESAWNRNRSPHWRTGSQWNQSQMSRCFPDWRSSASEKCKMVRKSSLNNSAILNRHNHTSMSSQKLPNRLNSKHCASQVLWKVLSGAPQRFWSSGTEYRKILQSTKLSSECYNMMALSW